MVPGYVDIAHDFLVKHSLLKDADKSKAVSLHSFSDDVYKVGHSGRVVFQHSGCIANLGGGNFGGRRTVFRV